MLDLSPIKKYSMRILTLLVFLLVLSTVKAQDLSTFFQESDRFFEQYVSNGLIDYSAIAQEPDRLNALMKLAKNIRVSPNEQAHYQAFWINTYNLAVIKGIITHYPVNSPLKVNGFFDTITYDVGGKNITLNDIENKQLRAQFPEEARFHFVLVCAGLGCPPIINQAYLPDTLESQLQTQTQLALNDTEFIRTKGKRVQLSQIFEWYKEDFVRNGTVIQYINRFRKNPIPEKAKVSYYPYDWTLNQQN